MKRKLKKTLADIAKEESFLARRRLSDKITDEQVELALAWVKGDVTFQGVGRALGKNRNVTSTYTLLARALRKYYQGI